MTSHQEENLVLEAVHPHLATDEGEKFLRGQEIYDRSLLSQHSNEAASQHLKQATLQYMWEEISPSEYQAELRQLFASNTCLRTPDLLAEFSPILVESAETEMEQAQLKKDLCDLLGLVTQKRDPSRPSLEDGIRFQQDVQQRFKSQPGKYEGFLHAGFGHWREGQPTDEVRAQLVDMLEGQKDLLERFGEIWPEKRN